MRDGSPRALLAFRREVERLYASGSPPDARAAQPGRGRDSGRARRSPRFRSRPAIPCALAADVRLSDACLALTRTYAADVDDYAGDARRARWLAARASSRACARRPRRRTRARPCSPAESSEARSRAEPALDPPLSAAPCRSLADGTSRVSGPSMPRTDAPRSSLWGRFTPHAGCAKRRRRLRAIPRAPSSARARRTPYPGSR